MVGGGEHLDGTAARVWWSRFVVAVSATGFLAAIGQLVHTVVRG